MTKNTSLTGIIVAAALFFFSSCENPNILKGNGAKGSVSPELEAFNSLQIELPVRTIITVRKGAKPSVKFSGYPNILQHVQTRIENKMLFISTDVDRLSLDCNDLMAEVTMPQIAELYLSGKPDVDIHGNLKGKSFKVDVSGDSKINIDSLNVDNFTYTAAGTADLQVTEGAARLAMYDINGASKIRAFLLQAIETTVTITGAGNAEITALNKLTTNVNGSGTIKYKGHPKFAKNLAGGTINDAN